MNIREATHAYEQWLRTQTRVIKPDLDKKHKAMANRKSAFPFLRATFYRWTQVWPQRCPDLASTPEVLAVGDLHVENFGTWRDSAGRLVWGANDFDESCPMPYAIDLVRLATSAILATREDGLSCQPSRACDAILEGYTEGIRDGGSPFVLEEHNRWLRRLATSEMREPDSFWQKLDNQIHPFDKAPALKVKTALLRQLPKATEQIELRHRRAGLGSLGRERVTALGSWLGARIAHEAKPLVPSAWSWARGATKGARLWYQAVLVQATRAPDPCQVIQGNWVFRLLGPHCCRIELRDLPQDRDEAHLLYAMGKETANIHRGSPESLNEVKKDLEGRPLRWVFKAASAMAEATIQDWKDWRGFSGRAHEV